MTGSATMSEPATVLLVDDEPRVLDSLEAMLGMDYRVIRTERPSEAPEMLARERIAVVISDQRMPGMLGTELLAQSLEVSPETVRILLTAFTDADALMASVNQLCEEVVPTMAWEAVAPEVHKALQRFKV